MDEPTTQKKKFCIKGWNFGETRFEGENLVFENDEKEPIFEVPLPNVMRCDVNETEAILEFHLEEDSPIQLMEMRIHFPPNPESAVEGVDAMGEFQKAVLKFTQVEVDSDQLCMIPQLPCITPRARYDLKVYHTLFSFHGRTYAFNVPFKSVNRTFLLPHKDNRHMFFVLQINPPIRQGQSYYQFIVLQFDKNDHVEADLEMTDEQFTQYEGKLDRSMKGPLFEVLAKLVRVLVKIKIIVPGKFMGASGTPAISCALRQSLGFLYPLEKGFIYIHKPTMYIRYEEVHQVHFARSDVSTRSFDFEILLKTGRSFLFGSVGKDEFNKLFDFVRDKGLKIRNANRTGSKPSYTEDKASDEEELDPYKEALKSDAAEKEKDKEKGDLDSDSDDEDYDIEADLNKKKKMAGDDGSSDESSGSDDISEDGSISVHDET